MEDVINDFIKSYRDCQWQQTQLYALIAKSEKSKDRVSRNIEKIVSWELLRPIESSDIKEGQIYFGYNSEGFYMREIRDVYNTTDSFKAWTANDGCRYGLEEHYVLK